MTPRVRIAALVISLAVAVAACGGDDSSSSPETTAAATATTAAAASGEAPKMAIVYSAEWQDGSWGQAAYDAANKLLADGVISDLVLQENVQPGAAGERALRALAEDGYNPIIAHSFNFGEDVKKVAPDYPNTLFVYAGGFGDVSANMSDYAQPFYQASYLQGILAAGVTGGGKVAGAAGFDIPVCQAMYQAFLAGAKTVNPSITGSFVAIGDWYDVQKAKEAALGQADAGATMFVGCGQAPTFGQIDAAAERGGVATGYVGDMSARGPSVLSSVIWNLDKTFEQMVADVAAGKVNPARYYDVGFKDGGLSIAINPARMADIPADVMAAYEAKLAEVKAGTFEVPFVGTAS